MAKGTDTATLCLTNPSLYLGTFATHDVHMVYSQPFSAQGITLCTESESPPVPRESAKRKALSSVRHHAMGDSASVSPFFSLLFFGLNPLNSHCIVLFLCLHPGVSALHTLQVHCHERVLYFKSTLLLYVQGPNTGTTLRQIWYCSFLCFFVFATKQIKKKTRRQRWTISIILSTIFFGPKEELYPHVFFGPL